MKKLIAALLLLALLPVLSPAALADEPLMYPGITLVVNGETVVPLSADGALAESFLYRGSSYLPLRPTARALGLGVAWDAGTGTVALSTGESPDFGSGNFAPSPAVRETAVHRPAVTVTLDGVVMPITDASGGDVAPLLLDGTLYYPARALADALGLDMLWNGSDRVITLTGTVGSPVRWLLREKHTELSFPLLGETVSAATEETYTYDARGNLLRCAVTGDDYSAESVYTYDPQDRLLHYQLSSSDGETNAAVWYGYDQQGRLLRQEAHLDGEISVQLLQYDDRGHVIAEELNTPGLSLRETSVYEGDRLTQRCRYENGTLLHTTTCRYDKAGRLTEERRVTPDGEEVLRTYTYNEAGLLRSESFSSAEDSRISTYRYTPEGWLASSRTVENGEESRYFYTYDAAGNAIGESHDESSGNRYEITRRFDRDGRLLRTDYAAVNAPENDYHEICAYDEHGALISRRTVSADGSEREDRWCYRYDEHGNILSAESWEGDVHTRIDMRYDPFLAQ